MIAPRQADGVKATTAFPRNQITELCEMFKLLSDENRLRIVLRICQNGEQNVTDLCQYIELPQPLVSHHLARLREAGILGTRRDGKHIYYSLHRERFQQLMSVLAGRQQRQMPCDCFLECMIG